MSEVSAMSMVCQVTGRKPSFGNSISHSHRVTKRRWDPNIQQQRFWLPSEKRWIKLTVSAKGIKTINKKGIEAVVADMRRQGVKI
jgi:large subunit ribosomal protein L28